MIKSTFIDSHDTRIRLLPGHNFHEIAMWLVEEKNLAPSHVSIVHGVAVIEFERPKEVSEWAILVGELFANGIVQIEIVR